jgi:outer membrane protein, heavy metal efflux system
MRQRADGSEAGLPASRYQIESAREIRRKYLLPCSFLLLAFPVGCVTTDGTSRYLSWRPMRSERPASKPLTAEIPAGRQLDRPDPVEKSAGDSKLKLVSNEQEANANTPQVAETSVPAAVQADVYDAELEQMTLPSSSVTLAQLEALALANNPTLTQSQAAVSAEQGIYLQAGLFPNPQMGYLNNTATRPGVEYSNGTYYSQEIPTMQKLKLGQAQAAVEINRYSWDNESQKRRVLNDLRIRYYEVLGAQEALKISEKIVAIAENIVRIAGNKVRGGAFSRNDLLQAERHLQFVRLGREEAQDRLHTAWEQMATMIGCSPMQPVPIDDELSANIPQLDRDAAWQELLNNSPQLRSSECDLGHAMATYNVERANAYPNVTVQIVTKYDTVTQADTISSLVAMPVPFTNRNQGNIDKASADILAARAEIARVRLVLREQLNDSFRKYRRLYRLTEKFRETIIPSVEESLDIATRNYENGVTSFTEVLTAQQEYCQTHENYVQSLTELHQVAVEIRGLQLTGGLNPAAIGSAIQNAPGGGGAQRQRTLLNEAQDRNQKQLMPAAQIGQ